MAITVVYNKFDVDAVIASAFITSYIASNYSQPKQSLKRYERDITFIESTSGINLVLDKNQYYLFLGLNKINEKFKNTEHSLINSYIDNETHVTILEALPGSCFPMDNIYAKQLLHALKVFNTREADENDLMVISKYYHLALRVMKGDDVFRFNEVTEEDKKEYSKFIKRVKLEFTNNFHKNHPLPIQEGLAYPAASISSDCCVWVRRFMKLVHKRYLNIILTTKGHVIDTDIPDIQKKLHGRNFILSSDY